jgi:drug/metabolite transporter (DMT)-like permease
MSHDGRAAAADPPASRTPAPLDVLVLLATLIWGVNYAIVKASLRELPELGFNALRLGLASALFLAVLAFQSEAGAGVSVAPVPFRLFPTARQITRRDWLIIAVLALVGQFVYQLCFLGGIARTSVANSALIQGCSPVVITLLAAAISQEPVGRRHWLGAALSLAGVYLLVGAGASLSTSSVVGDGLIVAGVFCWASYVVASRPLLLRYSPMAVSGYSMAIGTLLYFPLGVPELVRLDWGRVSLAAWAGLVYSAVFSLFLAYVVWYTSIKRVGNVRTAMYSNLIPIIALLTAVALGDRLSSRQVAGAAVTLAGVALTRIGSKAAAAPAEE